MVTELKAVHKQNLIRHVVLGVMPSTLLEMNYFSVSEEFLCVDHVGLIKFSIKLEDVFN